MWFDDQIMYKTTATSRADFLSMQTEDVFCRTVKIFSVTLYPAMSRRQRGG